MNAIWGAGGHCRSVVSLLKNNDVKIDYIYDENAADGEIILGIPVVTDKSVLKPPGAVYLGIGDNTRRRRCYDQLSAKHEPVIHPTSYVDNSAFIGYGTLVFGQAFVNSCAHIGENSILNTKCLIEHESTIGDHSHIAVGAIIAGRVKIGSLCFIGAGAVIKDNVTIVDNVLVGAGAVVVRDLSESGTYVGNPARRIR